MRSVASDHPVRDPGLSGPYPLWVENFILGIVFFSFFFAIKISTSLCLIMSVDGKLEFVDGKLEFITK